ncbi:hypothetical protein [Methanobrevibacter sp. DSM 116169]|uniref:hypothetical protein n=1 Tax=Methanobrevibacter sp. DSM 116169 TaxID=3242727 RepID=UPI0038FCF9A5
MSDVTKIHITSALSSQKIIDLMEDFPDLETITCSKSLFDRIPKKYLEALNDLDIEVAIEYNQGAKPKYSKEEDEILSLAKQNLTAKEISKKLDIPIKRVYYLLSKNKENIKFNNFKRKYDENTKRDVKLLNDEGKSPKDISSKLNIPIRTVYYILKGY